VAFAGVTVTEMMAVDETVSGSDFVAICFGKDESETWTMMLNCPT
jgi:hypothetical protein